MRIQNILFFIIQNHLLHYLPYVNILFARDDPFWIFNGRSVIFLRCGIPLQDGEVQHLNCAAAISGIRWNDLLANCPLLPVHSLIVLLGRKDSSPSWTQATDTPMSMSLTHSAGRDLTLIFCHILRAPCAAPVRAERTFGQTPRSAWLVGPYMGRRRPR